MRAAVLDERERKTQQAITYIFPLSSELQLVVKTWGVLSMTCPTPPGAEPTRKLSSTPLPPTPPIFCWTSSHPNHVSTP